MQTTSLSVVTAALFISGAMLAQLISSNAQPQSNTVSWRSNFIKRFQAADKDGDHALTREEAEAGQMTGIAEHFEEIDADKDGKVTQKEFRDYLKRRLRIGPMV